MSHYSAAPRRSYVIVHHTGAPNAHQDYSTNYCQYGYDFFVRYDGQIIVCGNWNGSTGTHALGCNCNSVGIMLNGCFGGCASGNLAAPSSAQECSLAYLLAHLRMPTYATRLRPHRNCFFWNPCGGGADTLCCGANLTQAAAANESWSSSGISFRNRVLNKRANWDAHCCCTCGSSCPQ